MEQYISKFALLSKIERLRESNNLKEDSDYTQFELDVSCGYDMALDDVKEFFDTIEVKEVDLEKEIDFAMPLKYCWSGDGEAVYSKEQMRNFAKHFFELGLNASNPLTWEDMSLIWYIGDEIPYNMPEEDFFKELLKRFKAQKRK